MWLTSREKGGPAQRASDRARARWTPAAEVIRMGDSLTFSAIRADGRGRAPIEHGYVFVVHQRVHDI
jgi:hypothetical protein